MELFWCSSFWCVYYRCVSILLTLVHGIQLDGYVEFVSSMKEMDCGVIFMILYVLIVRFVSFFIQVNKGILTVGQVNYFISSTVAIFTAIFLLFTIVDVS